MQERELNLQDLRSQIDEIDEQIVALYQKRMAVSREVAEYKIQTGKKVMDRERERNKINAVKELAENEFNAQGIEELYEQIISMSRKLQYSRMSAGGKGEKPAFRSVDVLTKGKEKAVFQGAEGAFSQEALQRFFGRGMDSFHVETFRDAMVMLSEQKADFAVLPIENSTAGVVGDIYDLLVEFNHHIVGEQILPIEHCLLGLPGTELKKIRTVYSHPQSLMQCSRFLNAQEGIEQVSMLNNAYGARKVQQDQDETQAAIASAYAGEVYGLEVLLKGINHNSKNATRFVVVTNKDIFLKGAEKISICFEIPHESGSLYKTLSHFIFNNLNMNKIESRPLENKEWEYRFFIDFDGNLEQESVINALNGLKEETTQLKILGNY